MSRPVLYGAETGNCLRAAIAWEEAELEYHPVRLDLESGQHRQPEMLTLNPAGKVPILVDESRPGRDLVLTQSCAIMLEAAARTPGRLLAREHDRSRALTLERFFYFVTDVIAPSHGAFALRGAGFENGPELLEQRSVEALLLGERFLDGAPYMAGSEFSIADVAALTIARASRRFIDWDRVPRLRSWFDAVSMRPSVQRGLHAFDPPDTAVA